MLYDLTAFTLSHMVVSAAVACFLAVTNAEKQFAISVS